MKFFDYLKTKVPYQKFFWASTASNSIFFIADIVALTKVKPAQLVYCIMVLGFLLIFEIVAITIYFVIKHRAYLENYCQDKRTLK